MAESASIINRSGPGEDAAFRRVLAAKPESVQDVALAVRGLIYDAWPETVDVVWPKQGSVGWGTGPKKLTEQFAYLMAFSRHVTLGFYHGGDLPDPAGLLPAQGGRQVSGRLAMRSLRLASVEEVNRPEVRALISAAVAHQPPAS